MIDLHLHLDGALSEEELRHLCLLNHRDPSEVMHGKFKANPDNGRDDWVDCFDFPCSLLQTAESLTYATYSLYKRLSEQGLLYAEVRFAPQLHLKQGMEMDQVVMAAIAGLEAAKLETKMAGQLILCAMTNCPDPKLNMDTVLAAKRFLGKGVCAIDLAGPEGLHHIDYYKDIFEKANELGVPITIHSDHKFGPVTIWESIKLGARRIGHGFDAIDDGMLTSFLANTGIPLELCPTSEVTYGPFDSYAQFTLKRLLDAGVKVTINTDDPTVFGCDLKGEYSIMEKTFGLTKDEVKKIMHNAVDAAFLDADQQAYLRELVDERLR